jgi:putative peptidoglycan lipid II flippase
MFLLLIPVVIGQAAGEVNRLVESLFAYGLGSGTVRALFLATRLVQLPLSIFGAATAVAILPTLSRSGARNDRDEMREVLLGGLRQSFFLIVPAMFGLMILARPIIQLLFERGEFGPEATTMTATAATISAAGLLSFAWVKVLATGFYAMQNTRTPVIIASACMILNVLLVLVLIGPLGYKGLALATALSYTINAMLLYGFLWQAIGPLYDSPFVSATLRIACATMLTAAAAYAAHEGMLNALGDATVWARLANTAAAIAAAIGVYLAACRMMKVEELEGFVRAFQRRVLK